MAAISRASTNGGERCFFALSLPRRQFSRLLSFSAFLPLGAFHQERRRVASPLAEMLNTCFTHSLSLHKFLAMAFEREGTDAATRASVFPCAACGRVRRNDGSTALLNVYYPWPKKWIRLPLAKAMTRESRIFSLCHRLHRASGKRLTGIWLHRFETDSSRDSVVEYTMSHSIGIERLRDSRNLSTSVKWGRLHICLSRAMHACIMRIVLFLEDSRISRQSGAATPIMIN